MGEMILAAGKTRLGALAAGRRSPANVSTRCSRTMRLGSSSLRRRSCRQCRAGFACVFGPGARWLAPAGVFLPDAVRRTLWCPLGFLLRHDEQPTFWGAGSKTRAHVSSPATIGLATHRAIRRETPDGKRTCRQQPRIEPVIGAVLGVRKGSARGTSWEPGGDSPALSRGHRFNLPHVPDARSSAG